MKLIKLETHGGWDEVINTSQICRIYKNEKDVVVITFAGLNDRGGPEVWTRFTDIDHAVDYLQRAPSCSLNMT